MTIKTLQFAIFGTILSLIGLQAWRWTRVHEAPGLIDIVTVALLAAQLVALGAAPQRLGALSEHEGTGRARGTAPLRPLRHPRRGGAGADAGEAADHAPPLTGERRL